MQQHPLCPFLHGLPDQPLAGLKVGRHVADDRLELDSTYPQHLNDASHEGASL